MKFKGEPNLFVRINKPKRGELKYFTFDKNGIYETNHPFTIRRLKATYDEIVEIELEKEIDVVEYIETEEELRHRAKEAGITSWHDKSIKNIKMELGEE